MSIYIKSTPAPCAPIYQPDTRPVCVQCGAVLADPFAEACDRCLDLLYAKAPTGWADSLDNMPTEEPVFSAYYGEYFVAATGQVVRS